MIAEAYPSSWYVATARGLVEYPSLNGAVSADVCVVGAGYTGLSAALHLAGRGYSVVVLDAQRVGWGASGRNGGQIGTGQRCDEAWLEALTQADLADLGEREHLTLLETRGYVFDCGCAAERLYPLIARLPEEDLTFVFEDGVAVIQCPRCGARYHVTRERFDDWREQQAEGGAS